MGWLFNNSSRFYLFGIMLRTFLPNSYVFPTAKRPWAGIKAIYSGPRQGLKGTSQRKARHLFRFILKYYLPRCSHLYSISSLLPIQKWLTNLYLQSKSLSSQTSNLTIQLATYLILLRFSKVPNLNEFMLLPLPILTNTPNLVSFHSGSPQWTSIPLNKPESQKSSMTPPLPHLHGQTIPQLCQNYWFPSIFSTVLAKLCLF